MIDNRVKWMYQFYYSAPSLLSLSSIIPQLYSDFRLAPYLHSIYHKPNSLTGDLLLRLLCCPVNGIWNNYNFNKDQIELEMNCNNPKQGSPSIFLTTKAGTCAYVNVSDGPFTETQWTGEMNGWSISGYSVRKLDLTTPILIILTTSGPKRRRPLWALINFLMKTHYRWWLVLPPPPLLPLITKRHRLWWA